MSRRDSYLRCCDGMIKIPINGVIAWQYRIMVIVHVNNYQI